MQNVVHCGCKPDERNRRADIFCALPLAQPVRRVAECVIAIEGVPHFHFFAQRIAQEFCFFTQPQAMPLRAVDEPLAAGRGQSIRLIFIHPDDIIKNTYKIPVMRHSVPCDSRGNKVFSFKFWVFVFFLNIRVEYPSAFSVNGMIAVFHVSLQQARIPIGTRPRCIGSFCRAGAQISYNSAEFSVFR